MIKIDVKASCENIKNKVESANITAKQLQEHLGVTITAPYVWLRGDGLPKLETLLNLCELLKCSISELLVIQSDDMAETVDSTLLNQYYYNKEGRKDCWDEMIEINAVATALFDLWNAYKYLYRAGDKADNSKEQDMKKAHNYIAHANRLFNRYQKQFSDETRFMFDTMLDKLIDIIR